MVLGHAFLTAAAGFSINLYTKNDPITWALGTFGLCFSHGVLGLIFCCTDAPSKYFDVYKLSLEFVEIAPLPFINTELYLLHNSSSDIAYIHALTAMIPLGLNLLLKARFTDDNKDLLIIGNVLSLIHLAIQKEKVLYGALAGLAVMNRFYIGLCGGRTSERLSFGLATFCLLSAYLIKTSEFSKYL